MRSLLAGLFIVLSCARTGLAQADALPEERFCKWLSEPALGQFADALGKAGFYPIRAEGRLRATKREFRIAFDRQPSGVHWWYCWYYNMDDDFYRTLHEKRLGQGYNEISHQEFTGEDGKLHHQVVWRKIQQP
jgi:hypothetical protein